MRTTVRNHILSHANANARVRLIYSVSSLTWDREAEAQALLRRQLPGVVGHEDVEEAHDARVAPVAAVPGHDGERLAVAHRDGARARVARGHADDVARLVPGLPPAPVRGRGLAQQAAVGAVQRRAGAARVLVRHAEHHVAAPRQRLRGRLHVHALPARAAAALLLHVVLHAAAGHVEDVDPHGQHRRGAPVAPHHRVAQEHSPGLPLSPLRRGAAPRAVVAAAQAAGVPGLDGVPAPVRRHVVHVAAALGARHRPVGGAARVDGVHVEQPALLVALGGRRGRVADLDAVRVGHPRGRAPGLGPQPVVLAQRVAAAHAGVARRDGPRPAAAALRRYYQGVVGLHDPVVEVRLVERHGGAALVHHLAVEALERQVAPGEGDVVVELVGHVARAKQDGRGQEGLGPDALLGRQRLGWREVRAEEDQRDDDEQRAGDLRHVVGTTVLY
uniref:Uncharacterized protein n=1 Tax=Zea mays TaxID=4577 RepID=A0A804LUB3_MAIZE